MMDEEFRKLNKRNNFLKRTLQLTLSVSIFSFILCYTSGFSFFPHSFNVYFSTFLFSFLTHTLERKYMFLICNGILVFLVKTSVSNCITNSSPSAYVGGDEFSPASELSDDNEVPVAETHQLSLENVPLVAEDTGKAEEEEKQQVKVKGSAFGEKERGTDEGFIAEAENDNKEGESGSTVVTQDEDSNAEVEANGDIRSVDELNKRIEEFIRKMKEEIRIEAQQQLITV